MKRKRILSTVVLIAVFITGLSLLLYPSVSDYVNSLHQSRAIAAYADTVANLDDEEYDRMLSEAHEFNKELFARVDRFSLPQDMEEMYERILNPGDYGVMGYIEIPSIKCSLPIYHGTDEAVLRIAVGHIEWSSLPVGGESTHCVVSGHRGLPSAKLFSNLDELAVGDTFVVRVLDEMLTYEVDQIRIVEPDDTDELRVVEGRDYFTLVTCTPYGVNTHRLLVRGHRTENALEAKAVRVTSDAIQIEPLIVAPVIAFPMLVLLLIYVTVRGRPTEVSSNDRRDKYEKQ